MVIDVFLVCLALYAGYKACTNTTSNAAIAGTIGLIGFLLYSFVV